MKTWRHGIPVSSMIVGACAWSALAIHNINKFGFIINSENIILYFFILNYYTSMNIII